MLSRFAEAVAIAEQLIVREPSNAGGHATTGTILHRRGAAAATRVFYLKGIELCAADDYMPYYDFACYWALEGNAGECEKYLAEALRRKPRMNTKAATDSDFERVRATPWFRALVVFKRDN